MVHQISNLPQVVCTGVRVSLTILARRPQGTMRVRPAFGCTAQHASRVVTALRTIWIVSVPVPEAAGDREARAPAPDGPDRGRAHSGCAVCGACQPVSPPPSVVTPSRSADLGVDAAGIPVRCADSSSCTACSAVQVRTRMCDDRARSHRIWRPVSPMLARAHRIRLSMPDR